MPWTMMRDSHAPGNGKVEIWWESEATEDDDAALELKEVADLLSVSESAMRLLEQAAATIYLERGHDFYPHPCSTADWLCERQAR
jgi:hypothetical protein